DEPARDLQAPQGAGEGGADLPQPRRPEAAVPDRGRAARRGRPVAGNLPCHLGGQLPAARRPAGRVEGRGQEETQDPLKEAEMKNALKVTTFGDREVVISRTFDAPRQLVWDTMSRPELLKRWLFGPPGWAMTVCEEDA